MSDKCEVWIIHARRRQQSGSGAIYTCFNTNARFRSAHERIIVVRFFLQRDMHSMRQKKKINRNAYVYICIRKPTQPALECTRQEKPSRVLIVLFGAEYQRENSRRPDSSRLARVKYIQSLYRILYIRGNLWLGIYVDFEILIRGDTIFR